MMPRKRWVEVTDPTEMFRFLHMTLTQRGAVLRRARKPALYVAALCRLHWDEMPWAFRALVDFAERKADGTAPECARTIGSLVNGLFGSTISRWEVVDGPLRPDYSRTEAVFLRLGYDKPPGCDDHLAGVTQARLRELAALLWSLDVWRVPHYHPRREWHSVPLLRDVAGDPYQPVKFDPQWRTGTAVALATHMYESRDFSAMPILADALQDAGCENPSVLDHCRGPGPHTRGCWVVDLLLDKE